MKRDVAETMYSMALNAEMSAGNDLTIKRVPGGWIYQFELDTVKDGFQYKFVFVPYSDEFKPKDKSCNWCMNEKRRKFYKNKWLFCPHCGTELKTIKKEETNDQACSFDTAAMGMADR